MRVEVYRNLHRGDWSVRALEGPDKGRVVAHAESVLIENAKFVVRKAGREKVLRERKKNVHAFVRGDLVVVNGGTLYGLAEVKGIVPVTYNPYAYESFVDKDTEEPIFEAQYVDLNTDGVRAWNPEVSV